MKNINRNVELGMGKKNNNNLMSFSKVNYTIENFVITNAHLGYEVKRWNPEMRCFLWGKRNGMHVLNLNITLFVLKRVFFLMSLLIKLRKSLLFVSENKQIDHVLRKIIKKTGQFISANRWIGGTMTNFRFIQRVIYYLMTRKPTVIWSKKKLKLKKIFKGMFNMYHYPSLVLILNGVKSGWAVNEIRSYGLLSVAIVDSAMSLNMSQYNIPGNVHGFTAQIFYLKLFQNVIQNSYLSEKINFKN